MAGAPIFDESEDMMDLVKRLIDERKDIFGEVNPDMIVCGLRVDKPAPEKAKNELKIEGVRGSRTLLSEKKYIFSTWQTIWDEWTEDQKFIQIAHALFAIKTPTKEELRDCQEKGYDFEYGKVKAPDMKDYKVFVQKFGVNWDNPPAGQPNIIDSSIKLDI